MMEAAPENVEGKIVQKHVFTHEVNWGYVALGLGLLGVAYLLFGDRASESMSDVTQPDVDGEEKEPQLGA